MENASSSFSVPSALAEFAVNFGELLLVVKAVHPWSCRAALGTGGRDAQCQTKPACATKYIFFWGKMLPAELGMPFLNCLTKSAQPKRPLAAGAEVSMTCAAAN